MSQIELARRLGTVQQTVSNFEKGLQRLTVEWMGKFAKALECDPQELISIAALAGLEDDVEPLQGNGLGAIAAIAAAKKLRLFKVLKGAVAQAGIEPGAIIGVDESAEPQNADIVLVSISNISEQNNQQSHRMLFQFLKPGLLVTNRRGFNVVFSTDDPMVRIRILGVVIQPGVLPPEGDDNRHTNG